MENNENDDDDIKKPKKRIKLEKTISAPRKFFPIVRDSDDKTGIQADMDEHGFCVIGNILDDEDQSRFEDMFWNAMEKRKYIDRNDKSTWIRDNYEWKGNYGAGQYKYYGMAHEEHCWLIRKNKKIRDIFEQVLFQGEECVVSLDGCAAMFEPVVSGLQLHVDLVPGLEGFGFGSVQGAYHKYEVAHDDKGRVGACFVCVPGSHKRYDELWEKAQAKEGFKHPKKHWLLLDSESPLQNETVQVISPANSLVLWKSELQHKNYGGDFTVEELGHLCRLTQFVSWQPKKFRTEKIRQKKYQCVLDGVSGNHWAALGFRTGIKPFPPWGTHNVKTVLPFKGITTLPEDIAEML